MNDLAKTNAEKLLDELYKLLLPYRKEAREVNFGAIKFEKISDMEKSTFYDDYLGSEVLEINNYRGYSIKVWVKKN